MEESVKNFYVTCSTKTPQFFFCLINFLLFTLTSMDYATKFLAQTWEDYKNYLQRLSTYFYSGSFAFAIFINCPKTNSKEINAFFHKWMMDLKVHK